MRRHQPTKGQGAPIKEYRAYLEKGRIPELDAHIENCSEEWVSDFTLTAKLFGKESNNVAMEYIQSWDAEESKRMGAEKLLHVGIETAREAFPNHQFVVIPQVGKGGNYHNHIMVNAVSSTDGRRISATYTERARFQTISDRMCRELGLSVPDRSKKAREKISRGDYEQLKKGKTPLSLQIMKAADFARVTARDMKEYSELLGVMGIHLDDRGKVLSYLHNGRQKPIRDRQLGDNYNKENLLEQFKRNEAQSALRPDLHGFLRGEVKRLHDRQGNLVGDSSDFPFAEGGHRKFTIEHFKGKEQSYYTDRQAERFDASLSGHSHYLSDYIVQANSLSIVDYCNKNRIALIANADGSHRLRGREHILIEDNRWRSTKSKNGKLIGTEGGLLEFVSNHKDIPHLEALALLTNNNRLNVLSKFTEFEAITYKEFHVPKSRIASERTAKDRIQALALHFGKGTLWADALMNTKKVQVLTDGAVRFLTGKNKDGAVEYQQKLGAKWIDRKLGVLNGAFIEQRGRKDSLKLFSDPFAFMEATKGRGPMAFKGDENILVLSNPTDRSVDYFLATSPHVKAVELIGFDGKQVSNQLKLTIEIHGLGISQGPSAGLTRERGIEL